VSVVAPSDFTGAQLIELVQRAARAGTMANISFHGIDRDCLSVSKKAHDDPSAKDKEPFQTGAFRQPRSLADRRR
jgi:hypothetical protein